MKSAKCKFNKTASKAALTSMLVASALLAACSPNNQNGNDAYVQCLGVSKLGNNIPVVMPKGLCEKLAGATAVPFSLNDYVECYGVAGAGKNDCATNSSACGGSVGTDRSPQAWLAMPRGICTQLKGGIVAAITTKDAAKTKSTPAIKKTVSTKSAS